MHDAVNPLEVGAALVWSAPGRILVQRRPANASFGSGALELPGGKIEAGETPKAAVVREIAEEWGRAAAWLEIGPHLHTIEHDYRPRGPRVRLHVFHARLRQGVSEDALLAAIDGSMAGLVEVLGVEALAPDAFLEADRSLVGALRSGRIPWPFDDAR